MSDDYYYDDPIDVDSYNGSRKFPKFFLALIALLTCGVYLQSTLAANVSINSGQNVEFGQGYTATTSCAGTPAVLKVTPQSIFQNASSLSTFIFKTIRVDNVPVACQGVDFTFSAWNSTDGTADPLFDSTTVVANSVTIFMSAANKFYPVNSGDVSVTTNSSSSFSLSFDYPASPSSAVSKIALQSAGHNANVGLSWKTTSNVPSSSYWNAVTYGAGKFVAIGTSSSSVGQAMYSSDGINWTLASGVPNHAWNNIAFGNGRFVASSPGYIMYSSDGMAWSSSSTNVSGYSQIFGAAFGNGKFVVSYSGGFLYSSDGSTWNSSVLSGWRTRLTFGSGNFVAMGNSSDVAVSSDGITWSTYVDTDVSGNSIQTVGYGDGTFVGITGSGISRSISSTDGGISWTPLTISAQPYQGLCYGNGNFIAIGNDSSSHAPQGMFSPDGTSWTALSNLPTGSWNSITYGAGEFVAVATTGQVAYSN